MFNAGTAVPHKYDGKATKPKQTITVIAKSNMPIHPFVLL